MRYILVCDRKPNIQGKQDIRPMAAFTSMDEARRFLRILVANKIYAVMIER